MRSVKKVMISILIIATCFTILESTSYANPFVGTLIEKEEYELSYYLILIIPISIIAVASLLAIIYIYKANKFEEQKEKNNGGNGEE